jgi:cytochrome b561
MSAISEPSRPDLDAKAHRGAENHYDVVQRTLHWTMAVVILLAIAIGLYCEYVMVPGTPVRRFLLDIHKSLGMTALVLLVIRFAYRLIKGAPAYIDHLSPLMHAGASMAHWALYAVMLYMPVTGYINSGAGGNTLPWFGLFQWPRLVPLDKPLAHLGSYLHGWGAYAIYILVGLHIAAALWHLFVRKDSVFSRMLPPR